MVIKIKDTEYTTPKITRSKAISQEVIPIIHHQDTSIFPTILLGLGGILAEKVTTCGD